MKRLVLLVAALGLTACVSPTLKPGTTMRVGPIAVTSPIAWSQFGTQDQRDLTIDGFSLNRLLISVKLKPGQHVFRQSTAGRKRQEGVRYRADMDANEIQDLIVDGLTEAGFVDVRAEGLRPARLAGRPGLRFELAMASPAGLRYRGMVVAEGGNELELLMFFAPEEYYFERDRAAVEAIFRSAAEAPG
jgi:hypothetical protein